MRVYTCCGFDISTSRLTAKICPDILSEYFHIEPLLKHCFDAQNIEMYPCAVYSNYNGINKTVPQIVFIYKKDYFSIPNYIFESLETFLMQCGFSFKKHIDHKIYFGYTGRFLSRSDNSMLVTDGLQRDTTSDIIIDFLTYKNASKNMLYHRLMHELLHVLGINEEEMPKWILPACIYTYDVADQFVSDLLYNCRESYHAFTLAVKEVQNKNSVITSKLKKLSENLYYSHGFDAPPEQILTCKAYHPSNFNPPHVSEIEILFM